MIHSSSFIIICEIVFSYSWQPILQEKDAVMFALKKNQTEFRGRALRISPSTENPQQGRLI